MCMINQIQTPTEASHQTAVMVRPPSEVTRPTDKEMPSLFKSTQAQEAVNDSLVDHFTDRRIKTAANVAVKNAMAEMGFVDPIADRVLHAERVMAHTPTEATPKRVPAGRLRPQDLGRQK